jgi:methylphosphotriester-DNA--protein-cysteine methyltransferase
MPATRHKDEKAAIPASDVVLVAFDGAEAIDAAELLRRTRWTQERIAARSGFRSVDALQRAFARKHGVTPHAYRQRRMEV